MGCSHTPPVLLTAAAPLPPMKLTRSELVLDCAPADAEVELEGVPQGTCEDFGGTPRGLSLGDGTRRVVVKKSGYLPWDCVVEADGTRVMMTVTLISIGAASP